MIQVTFVIIVILHALENALRRKRRLAKNDYRDIKKLPEVIIYTSLSAVLGIVGYNVYDYKVWYLIALSVVTRMVFFDIFFNMFSGRYLGYENKKGNSLVDRIEQVLPFWHRLMFYLFAYIYLLV